MTKKPVVGMILERFFPPDIRVEKEARVLADAGYEVHILCWSSGKEQPAHGDYHSVQVHRLLSSPKRNIKFLLYLLFYKFTFLSFLVYPKIEDFVKRYNIDILHVHDLVLVNTALRVKKQFPHLKIVADLHENYPASMAWGQKCSRSKVKSFCLNWLDGYDVWIRHEGRVLKQVDSIITVVDEMRARLIKTHHLPEDKIVVVANFEDKDFVHRGVIDTDLVSKFQDNFVVGYIGGLSPVRGLPTAIRGMSHLKDKNIKLILIGDGASAFKESLKQLILDNDLTDHVEMCGWYPFDKMFSFMEAADVCVIPHDLNEQTDNSMPNKLTQYMMVGKPIVVSNCASLMRVVRTFDVGLVFKSGDSVDFANKILQLYNDPKLRQELGDNGKKATLYGKMNWQEESKKLVSLYDDL